MAMPCDHVIRLSIYGVAVRCAGVCVICHVCVLDKGNANYGTLMRRMEVGDAV